MLIKVDGSQPNLGYTSVLAKSETSDINTIRLAVTIL